MSYFPSIRHLKAGASAAAGYLWEHPDELLRVARSAAAWRVGVPLDALRWLARELAAPGLPVDVELESVPPGLRAAATVELMGNSVRASAVVFVERTDFGPTRLELELRLAEVGLELLRGSPESPVVTLLRSGALDLSKPGNLVANMPRRPAFIVSARDDRIVLDLARHPKLAEPRVQKLLALLTPLIVVDAVETDWEHLDVALRPLPEGVGEAVEAVRRAL